MSATGGVDILLVEDNPHDLELALRAIRQASIATRVEIARDGVEALEYIFCEGPHAARNIAERPRLILLDLKMPRIDGLEVLRRIKGDPRTRRIPVVILTTSTEQRHVIESYQLDVNSFIVKPVNLERFVEAVQAVGAYWLSFNQVPPDETGT